MAFIRINIPNNPSSVIFDQNNFVRLLQIPSSELSGVGTIKEQICEYILSLPIEQRTILETDSKWNIEIIQTSDIGIFDNTFDNTFD